MNDHTKFLQKKIFLRRPTNFWGSGTWKQTIFLVWPYTESAAILTNRFDGNTYGFAR